MRKPQTIKNLALTLILMLLVIACPTTLDPNDPNNKEYIDPLIAADLSGVDLSGTNLSGRNLSMANLSNANLSNAILMDANLMDANLMDANLMNLNLINANLNNADLRGTGLRNANANLTGAYLHGIKINWVDYTNLISPDTNFNQVLMTLYYDDDIYDDDFFIFIESDVTVPIAGDFVTFERDSYIFFHDRGSNIGTISGGDILSNQRIGENTYLGIMNLAFDENGQVIEVFPTNHTPTIDTTLYVKGQIITFDADDVIYFHGNGVVNNGVLGSNVMLSGTNYYEYMALTFNESGEVTSMYPGSHTPLRDINIAIGDNTITFQALNIIYLYENGAVNRGKLASNQLLGDNTYLEVITLTFDESGEITSVSPASYNPFTNATLTISGQTVTFEDNNVIHFYESGVVNRGVLGSVANLTVGSSDIVFENGDAIYFYENGGVSRGVLGNNVTISGTNYYHYMNLTFNESGVVGDYPTRYTPRADTTIIIGGNAVAFDAYDVIYFYENTAVNRGVLGSNASIIINGQTIAFEADKNISFYENGIINSGFLANNADITVGNNAVVFANSNFISFYENGAVSNGSLANNITISSTNYYEYMELAFNQSGKVISRYPNSYTPRRDFTITIAGDAVTFDAYDVIYFYENTAIDRGVLGRNANISVGDQTIAFEADRNISFYENGNIKGGKLVSNQLIGNNTYVEVMTLTFDENEDILSVSPTTYRPDSPGNSYTTLIVYGRPVTFFDALVIYFYESGTVSNGILASNQTINVGNNAVSFSNGGFANNAINFYENGTVSSGILASNQILTVGGNNVAFTTKIISFYDGGAISNGFLTANHTFNLGGQGVILQASPHAPITFYRNGVVVRGLLAGDQNLSVGSNDIRFNNNEIISFYESGKIRSGTLRSDIILTVGDRNIAFDAATIHFYESGAVRQGYLNVNTSLSVGDQMISFDGAYRIGFYENGAVKQGRLQRNTPINGRSYIAGAYLKFNADASVLGQSGIFDTDF